MPAKKEINLLEGIHQGPNSLENLLNWVANIGRWIVVVTEFIVICAFLSRFYFDTKLAILFDEVKEKQVIVSSTAGFEENFRLTQEKIKFVKQLLGKYGNVSGTIQEVSKLLPLEVTLESFAITNNKVTLEGISFSEKGVHQFIKNLLASQKFEKVNLEKVSQGKGKVKVEFKINLEAKK